MKAARSAPRAVRFTLRYDDHAIRVLERQEVEMTVPSSDGLKANDGAEFWFEVKDARDASLYRRAMRNPIRGDFEVFTGDPRRPMHRVADTDRSGVFTIVVPDLESAAAVTLSSSSFAAKRRGAEIVRFPFRGV